MITYLENELTVEDYLKLRAKVNWKPLSVPQAEQAIKNSLYIVTAIEDGQLIGMGRIVGDGAVICYVQDLIVVPDAQGKGVGSELLKRLQSYVDSLRMEHSEMMLCLMCAKGRESFYESNGFLARPTDNLGPGMIMYLSGE